MPVQEIKLMETNEQNTPENAPATRNIVKDRRSQLREALKLTLSRQDPPTADEIAHLIDLVKELPGLDFRELFRVAKERNTEQYREAVEEIKRRLNGH